ncbi:hypothetical protein N7520_007990 [Penicillium odoratum]|uniref:uncharacterized protein n=1 Tax=Penicillium odoratum TaxID=1167516 RepID=UPI0025474E04|nr:uncharacterized protein N7520_007990 [Penicillium odoratum]KAJ5760834.1 hypothetical protein N7520_007990 [Penicillium odoratum]
MATPSAITIGNSFTGKWMVNKKVSPGPEPTLKLQGVGWVLRKAAALAVVTLHISISSPSASQSDTASPQKSHISVIQVPTAGLGGTSETRILDWDERTQLKDFIFGNRQSRNRFVTGKAGVDGRILPDLVPETKIDNEVIGQMLRGEIPPEGDDGSGFLVEGHDEAENAGLWIHSFDCQSDGAWTMEQVWGFEMIRGERYHTRRFVAASKGNFVMGRVVFSYAGSIEGLDLS